MGGAPVPGDVVLTLARAAAANAPPRPRSGPDELGAALEAVVDGMPPGDDRRGVLLGLAERRPDLILRRATDWLTDADTDVLVRLPQHFLRVAVAHSLRPWSRRSIDAVVRQLRDDHVVVDPRTGARGDPTLAEVVGRVMADAEPGLMWPAGVPRNGPNRWRVIGCETWEWALWRCDDGRYALDTVISSGLVEFEVGELVDEALVEAWVSDGPAALDAAVEQLRARHRTPRPPV